jgi:enoyl-CoA hydratase/carnithine racemase
MTDNPVRLRVENGIAFCELCSPPGNVMNAAFFECFHLLKDSFSRCDVQGMVVCGCGRHFSSGADVDEIKSIVAGKSKTETSGLFRKNHQAFESLAQLAFPVVAAISGCCLGAGLELALACHYRVAAQNSVFALPEATFGLMPGCGGTIRLPGLAGIGKAVELALSGRTLAAEEALACGLVDLVVEKKALLPAAVKLIDKERNISVL